MEELIRLREKVSKLELLVVTTASMHSALLDILKEKGTITEEEVKNKMAKVQQEVIFACTPVKENEIIH
jgi:hypothetical protein